jgi:hypothetical protein
MKPLKTCSHRALGCEGAKNSGFSPLHLILRGGLEEHILRKKLFFQTIYQNGSNSTNRVVHRAKTASLVKWSSTKWGLRMVEVETLVSLLIKSPLIQTHLSLAKWPLVPIYVSILIICRDTSCGKII